MPFSMKVNSSYRKKLTRNPDEVRPDKDVNEENVTDIQNKNVQKSGGLRMQKSHLGIADYF